MLRLGLAALLLLSGCTSVRNLLPLDFAAGRPMLHPVPADFIDAIDRPLVASTSEALLDDRAQVIGVVGFAGTARAYPTDLLGRHEIVNDVLDGEPIAVVW
jgi:hypothetical protein